MTPDGLTGKRLAEARRAARLSQRTLAAALGVSVRTLQYYEAGRFVPYRHLEALSRLLQRPSAWLLYGLEQPELDSLLARSQRQRRRLQANLARLGELRDQLCDEAQALGTHGRT